MKNLSVVIFLIRLFLAVVFIIYGLVKLLGGQFYQGDFSLDSKTLDPTFLVWAFFGYSKIYSIFIGLGELVPAILLLIPKTRTLGAMLLFLVTLNVTVMTFSFGFPEVKYASLFYMTLCLILLLYDYEKLKFIFWETGQIKRLQGGEVVESDEKISDEPGWFAKNRTLKIILASLIVIPTTLFALNVFLTAVTPGPEEKAVAALVERGWKKEDLNVLQSRYTGLLGVNREGFVKIEVKNSNPPKIITVEVYRSSGFTDWQITKINEEAKP